MAAPPAKWYQHDKAPKQRKPSPLKTIALGDGSYFPEETEIEHVERISLPGNESLPPQRPAKALIRELSTFLGRNGNSRFGSYPYVRLRGGTGGSDPAARPAAPPTTPAARGLPKMVHPLNSSQQVLMIPPTTSIKIDAAGWPPIYFGDDVPSPRVRFTLDPRDPKDGRGLSQDLTRKAIGKGGIHSTVPTGDTRLNRGPPKWRAEYRAPRTFDSEVGLGGLQWVFDAGDSPGPWKGLTKVQVIEFLYRSVEEVLGDWVSRDQIRASIRNGPIKQAVQYVEDPLPPLPPPPDKSFPRDRYGAQRLDGIMEMETYDKTHDFWKNYARDELATRPGQARDPMSMNTLSQRLFANMREAFARPDNVRSLSQTSCDEGEGVVRPPKLRVKDWGPGSDPPFGVPPSRNLQTHCQIGGPNESTKESAGDPMQTVPMEDPELGLDPTNTIAIEDEEGRTARVGEYKCVWFGVTTLVLSMFLCLFLYSFRIIR